MLNWVIFALRRDMAMTNQENSWSEGLWFGILAEAASLLEFPTGKTA